MDYKISSKAQTDLIGIWEYTFDNWSVEQADRYLKIIIERIGEICLKPDIGKNYAFLRNGYWGVNIKSHIIFYRIQDDNIIEVIRILHQRMDFQNRLGD